MAVSSPLLETSINGAKGVLVNVTGSMDIGLEEVETAATLVQQAAHPDANIIFGAAFDEELEDEIRVTVIATGFEDADSEKDVPSFSQISSKVTKKEPAEEPAAMERASEAEAESETQEPHFESFSEASQKSEEPKEPERDPFDDLIDMFNRRK